MGSDTDPWYKPCYTLASRYLALQEPSPISPVVARARIVGTRNRMPWATMLELVYRDLVSRGCYPRIQKGSNGIFLLVRKGDSDKYRVRLALFLALTTLVSVYLSGMALTGGIRGGLPNTALGYLVGLLVPLVIHELGHWLTLRKYKTPASMPYLIPAPPLQAGFLGTFGAVINLRWLPPSERGLALSALMGPLAGFIAALPFAVWGVRASSIMPAAAVHGTIPLVPLVFLLIPPPRPLGPHEVLVLSPMGFAAFVVFFVTFLNLIPVATLDGGHIVRALLGYKGHRIVSRVALASLALLSLKWPMLALFTLIAFYFHVRMREGHPGSAMGIRAPRDPVMLVIALVYALLLILTLPVPAS